MIAAPAGRLCRPLVLLLSLTASIHAQDLTVLTTPEEAPREQLRRYLNKIGLEQLQKRRDEITRIKTTEDMERRKSVVRDKVLRLLGGLPEYDGPLNTRQLGSLEREGYRMEKIIYESLPGFHVTANVYVPASGPGPFPAVLMPVGHSPRGKEGERTTAVGLARKGFVVLKYDALGQGERLQYYDPDLRASKVGGPTEEHSHANGHTMLIGDNIARYRIWDGMRGIDYLISRDDVDAGRIGCTGCSGGGTAATYISALDDRVAVAAPACYITSWEELMVRLGPQDSEQSLNRFLAEGLNIADYVELFAPKPWLSASTIDDFFPLEGARQTYEEAKRIYALYGAEDKIGWYIGPGPHGVPQPSREAIYAWFIKWLKNGEGDPREEPVKLDPYGNILCTKTGQVSDSLGGETVFTLNKKRAAGLLAKKKSVSSRTDLDELRQRLSREVREVAAISVSPGGSPPSFTVHRSIERDTYRLEVVSYAPEKGIEIPGLLFVPDVSGRKPAVLVADSRSKEASSAAGGNLDHLARQGYLVFAVWPRGIPEEGHQSRSVVGDQVEASRAAVVGKTVVGMRTEDIIRAVDYLTSRDDVEASAIAGWGHGALGVPMLHAALLDDRIGRIALEETLALYRLGVDRPVHRTLYDVHLPGVLRHYDLDEILAAIHPRPVMIIRPVDALGVPLIRLEEFRDLCRYAFEIDASLGHPQRIQVVERGRQEVLEQFLRK